MKEEIKFEFEYGETYYFPYDYEIGAGEWEWSFSSVDFQRLKTLGIFRTKKGALVESKKIQKN